MVFKIIIMVVGVAIFIFSIGMAFNWIPVLTDTVSNLLGNFFSTVSGLFITIYGAWQLAPDPIKSIVAKVLRKIPSLPNYYKRRTVRFELESEINKALKEFGKEGAGFIDEKVTIKWLTPGEKTRRIFFQGGKAFLKLDFEEDKERNLVEAVLMYCNECLLLETRPYIEKPLMRAIDITFIDELLNKRNIVRGRAYFTQEVIPREIEETKGIDKYLNTLELISQQGIFSRILLPELKEYPARTQRGTARKNHLQQIEELIVFLQTTAEDRTRLKKRVWLHIGETIRIGVMLVGLTDKINFEGTKPYVRRTAMDNSQGAHTVYLIGYNLGVNFVTRISHEVARRGICEKCELNEYHALVGNEVKRQTIARLSIPEGSGSRFLEKYPNMREWPDLEEETVFSTIGKKDAIATSLNTIPVNWDHKLHREWLKKAGGTGESIVGTVAAGDAVKIFGISRLKEGKYKTLQKILDASPYLSKRWSRDVNRIIKL